MTFNWPSLFPAWPLDMLMMSESLCQDSAADLLSADKLWDIYGAKSEYKQYNRLRCHRPVEESLSFGSAVKFFSEDSTVLQHHR